MMNGSRKRTGDECREKGPDNGEDNKDTKRIKPLTETTPDNAECIDIRDKIISIVDGKLEPASIFNSLTLEKLRIKSIAGSDIGKSGMWWLAWAVSQGKDVAFLMAWWKLSQDFMLDDFRHTAEEGPDKGISALWLLACATRGKSEPFNLVCGKWGAQITVKDLRTRAEEGPARNILVLSAMIRAAKDNKIKREVIEEILATLPDVCSIEYLFCKPTSDPSIAEVILQGIHEGCNWCVKLKQLIDARNSLFEAMANLDANPQPTAEDFFKIEHLANAAYKLGCRKTLDTVDPILCIVKSIVKKDWHSAFRLLEHNAFNGSVMSKGLYNLSSKLARDERNFLIINGVNKCFGKNKEYNHDDFSYQYACLNKYYEPRFKPSASFVAHALIKKGADHQPISACQYNFSSPPVGDQAMVRLNSINSFTHSGRLLYEAHPSNNQKMISTDIFNVEVKTKVGATFVCEEYDLVFFVPRNNNGQEEGLFPFEPESLLSPNFKETGECPVIRGGVRELVLEDMHMRNIRAYQNDSTLKENDNEGVERAIPSKSIEPYKAFYKSINNNKFYCPERLHAIGKQYYRPNERHYDISNLAISPQWVNSLMMVIECSISWLVVHSPFAKFKLNVIFETYPMQHALKKGTIEATMETEDNEIKISKELHPHVKCYPFPRISDITQATLVLNRLLSKQLGEPIDISPLASDSRRSVTKIYDSSSGKKAQQNNPRHVSADFVSNPLPHTEKRLL